MNFAVLWLYTKVFSANLGCDVLWRGKSEQSVKLFSVKIVFFTNLRKFSPLKVSRYTVLGASSGFHEKYSVMTRSTPPGCRKTTKV